RGQGGRVRGASPAVKLAWSRAPVSEAYEGWGGGGLRGGLGVPRWGAAGEGGGWGGGGGGRRGGGGRGGWGGGWRCGAGGGGGWEGGGAARRPRVAALGSDGDEVG